MPVAEGERYCDETCCLTWVTLQLSKLSTSQKNILEKHGIGLKMTEEQIDAVLERLKRPNYEAR